MKVKNVIDEERCGCFQFSVNYGTLDAVPGSICMIGIKLNDRRHDHLRKQSRTG